MISSILPSPGHPSGEGRQKIHQLSDSEGGGSSKSDLVIRGSHAAFMLHSPPQNDGGERKDSTKTSCCCKRSKNFTQYRDGSHQNCTDTRSNRWNTGRLRNGTEHHNCSLSLVGYTHLEHAMLAIPHLKNVQLERFRGRSKVWKGFLLCKKQLSRL